MQFDWYSKVRHSLLSENYIKNDLKLLLGEVFYFSGVRLLMKDIIAIGYVNHRPSVITNTGCYSIIGDVDRAIKIWQTWMYEIT